MCTNKGLGDVKGDKKHTQDIDIATASNSRGVGVFRVLQVCWDVASTCCIQQYGVYHVHTNGQRK